MNGSIWEYVGVSPIEKMIETCLRWVWSCEEKSWERTEAVVWKVDQMEEDYIKKGGGRPKKKIGKKLLKNKLILNELIESLVS